jgi:hydroxymethylpyrimidine pyrophosphatase-like HAD family hydrolase
MDDQTQKERRKPEMAVFDIDGTIKRPGEPVPEEVIAGFRHLRERQVITTISTGRPYVRMREALGDYFDEIIADTALISVEHGAKIVDKHGEVQVQSELSNKDIDKLLEFTGLNLDMVNQLQWNPPDLSKKTQIWTPEPADIDKIREKRGWYADVFGGSLVDVKAMLYEESVSNVTLRLKEHIHVENLKLVFTGGSIKAIFQDGLLEYMKTKVTKARAIRYMCAHFGIYEHHLLVAGNAINDVDMLNMGAGHRILVGEEGHARETVLGYIYDSADLIYLNNPEDLGRYLQSL